MQKRSGSFTGSSRGELSTAAPREAKPPEVLDSGAVFVVIRLVIRHGYPAGFAILHSGKTVIHALSALR